MGVNGIYGLSGSGLDIESMVKVGMMSKQSQYDKMQQKYTKNEWKKSAMVDLYNTMQSFNTSTLSQYKLSSNMDAHSAESTNSGIKATANASAPIMRHNVEFNTSATNAYLIGTNSLSRIGEDATATSTQLRDVLFNSLQNSTATYTNASGATENYISADGGANHERDDVAFSFSVGDGVNGGITSTNPKSVQVSNVDLNTTSSGEHSVNVTAMKTNVTLISNRSLSATTSLGDALFGTTGNFTDNGDGTFSFVRSGTTHTFNASDTAFEMNIKDGVNSGVANIKLTYQDVADGKVSDLVSQIQSKLSDAGLNIEFEHTSTGKFKFTNTEAGSENTIAINIPGNSGTSQNGTNTALFMQNSNFKTSLDGGLTTNDLSFSDNVATNYGSGNGYRSVTGGNAIGTIDGTSVTFDSNNEAVVDGVTYKATGVGSSTINVDTNAIKKNTVSVTYGQLLDGYTFNDLSSAVNNLGQNARMTYDSVNDKFSLYNKESGSSNGIAISITAGDSAAKTAEFFNSIGLKQSANGTLSDTALSFAAGETAVATGTNAKVKVDGVDYDLNENKVSVNGVTYDFTNATEGTSANVSVTQDKDKIIDMVKNFVKDYNELLSTLYKAYDEKPNSNYKPLTESQKSAMKDEQIEKWEEKAKAGMLYHDRTLGKAIDDIRSAVTTQVDGIAGKYNSIFSIGISTTGIKGQLRLDEDKLKAALNDDSQAVYNVFAKLEYKNDATTASGKLQQASDNYSKSGIAQRLGDVFLKELKSFKSVSGSNNLITEDSELNTLLRELQTKMSNFKSMMNAFETRLYKKYDAMETMLSRLGTQLNYVTSAFA